MAGGVQRLGGQLLKTLPDVSLAFAYGSGVFVQPDLYSNPSGKAERPQVDFILAVDDAFEWHRENLISNPSHYSGLSSFGPRWIEFVSSSIGVGVHFNTLVPFKEQVVKYGVLNLDLLKDDLMSWRHLYISGRLHKPVMWIKESESLKPFIAANREAALAMALLMCPAMFTKKDLFRQICGLSYTGDIRMSVAEDKMKIERIVDGSFGAFDALYSPVMQGTIRDMSDLEDIGDNQLKMNPKKKPKLLSFLPESIRNEIAEDKESTDGNIYIDRLPSLISNRVSSSSRRQALAGFLTSGWHKSLIYLNSKLRKAFNVDH